MMKSYASASPPPAKRRCNGIVLAIVALGLCSLVLPLALLLGLFPSGYLTDELSATEFTFGSTHGGRELSSEYNESTIDELIKRFTPPLPKEVTEDDMREADGGKKIKSGPSVPTDATSRFKGPPATETVTFKAPPSLKVGGKVEKKKHANASSDDESERCSQLEFGSYCLWSVEHKFILKDSKVKRLKDQLFVARAYFPSVAKLAGQERLTRELKQHIQEHERMLSEAISDADLPRRLVVGSGGRSTPSSSSLESKMLKMDQIIERAKSCALDCNNVEKKLRQLLDLTEDEAHFHMKQSAFLYQLGAQTMPKSVHCLSMRLTVEYFKSTPVDVDQSNAHLLDRPGFRNYVIFSRNVLAVSVAINSTVMNSEETGNMVFHLLTDGQNFYAMKLWFARNSYKEASIHVLNIEDLSLNHHYNLGGPQLSPSEEFRVSIPNINQPSPTQTRTEYISVFGHSHFLLPEIFKTLEKVVVLDDDVVVQRDLSSLWNLDLGGKVNGAVEFCGVRLGQLQTYLGGISHDADACAWMSGVNIIDLEKWREYNVTGIYQRLLDKVGDVSEDTWRAAALPISLLAFQDLIYALDDSWVVSGLGHDFGFSADTIKDATALHYNGHMKPWLELGIPRYKGYWKKFLAQGERFMDDCYVNP